MSKTIFDFKNYRKYLSSALPVVGAARGQRTRLAEALRCQTAFISLVIHEGAHLSLEQAMNVNRFMNHDFEESDFFLLLVHLARAGSKELENYYQIKIDAILEKREAIKSRIQTNAAVSEIAQSTYYSRWHFSAIHMAILIPELRTRKAIAEYLDLPQNLVAEILTFMVENGLAIQNGNEFETSSTRFHLPQGSPLLAKHHTNWRMKAIQSLDEQQKQDLHYTLIMSASDPAAEKIRKLLLQFIQEIEPVLTEAKDEEVYCLNLDLFGIK